MLNDSDREALAIMLLSIVSAITGYLVARVEGHKSVKIFVIFVRGMTGALVGYLWLLYGRMEGFDYNLIALLAGGFWLLGSDVSVWTLGKLLKRRLGIHDENLFYPTYRGRERREKQIVTFTVATNGRILWVSDNVMDMLGYNALDLIGMDHSILVPFDFRPAHDAAFTKRAKDPEITPNNRYGRAVEALSVDGTMIPCRIDIQEEMENGKKIFTAILSREVTYPLESDDD